MHHTDMSYGDITEPAVPAVPTRGGPRVVGMRRKRVWSVAIIAAIVVGAFGLYWFQPWKLFTSKTVHDTAPILDTATAIPSSAAGAPTSPAAPTARLVAGGALITHEHDTSGTAEIVRLPDGKHQLVLRDLSTSDGPDLRVWLTDQPVVEGRAGWHVFDDGRYVEVGRLKGTHGTLVYDLAPDFDPSGFTSVTIWCRRFAVSFGAAPLVVR
jgi:electron transfer DM13